MIEDRVQQLKTARKELVDRRIALAADIARNTSDRELLVMIVEVQDAIDAVDSALEDEERASVRANVGFLGLREASDPDSK